MKPNAWVHQRDVVSPTWSFLTDPAGRLTNEATGTAAALETVRLLAELNAELGSLGAKLDSLGADGIHGLIRLAEKEHRRREQIRKARARALRKRKKAVKR